MRRFVPLSVAAFIRAADRLAAAAAEVESQGTRQHFLAAPVLTQVRFNRWEVARKDDEAGSAAGPYLRGLRQFARGMSYAARGDTSAANVELERLQRSWRAAETVGLTIKNINRASRVLMVARWQLQSAIATARRRHADAVRFARAAVAAEDRLAADDPPVWPVSARHMLGAALLSTHQAVEAQRVFSEDLKKHPQNCVALAGLSTAERAQRSSPRSSIDAARLSALPSHCPK